MFEPARRALSPVFALLVASAGLLWFPSAVLAGEWDAEGTARLEQATRLYTAGQYQQAEELLVRLAAEHPETPSVQRKLGLCYYYLRRPEPALINLRGYLARTQGSIAAEDREDVERWIREMEALRAQSSVPTYQSGFLLVPYFGLQFPFQAAGWISSGLRVGTLIGGHLSRHISLSAEPAFATWTFNGCDTSHFNCTVSHRAAEFDLGVTLLGHVRRSKAEIVFGPRIGWSIALRQNFDERTYPFVDGPQFAAKIGVFGTSSPKVGVGLMLDLAYTRSLPFSSSCFPGESACSDTKNTLVGALTGALLF